MTQEIAAFTPEERLIHRLAERDDPDLIVLRHSVGLGAYLRGALSAPAAAALIGTDGAGLEALLQQRQSLTLGSPDPRPRISVIIPVYNEEENLPILVAELVPVLVSLGDYEVLFVDDGSKDRSVPILLDLRRENPRLKVLQLSRNFGHQPALSAGLEHARGEAVVLMDADLQDPPGLLRRFVQEWEAGYKVVYAVRTKRKESAFKRGAYWGFYRLLRRLADIEMPLDSGDFCLMDRAVVDALVALPEKNRFLRGLRTWVGFDQIGITYDRPARHAGEVKYTLRKLIRLALSGLLAFTSTPLRFASYLGVLTAAIGLAYLMFAVVARVLSGAVPEGWTSIVAIVLILGGAQLLVMGVLGEYLAKVYEESKQRPVYVVGETHGLGDRHRG